MLSNRSKQLFLRTLCFAAGAAALAACSGGGSPQAALPPAGGAATLSSTTAPSAPSLVQSATGSVYAASPAVSFSHAPAPGDTVVVALSNNGMSSGGANQYTAPAGWSVVDVNASQSFHTYEVFSHVVTSGEANRYVFSPGSAQREHVWMAGEIANTSGVDKRANAYVSGSTAYTTPSVTPSNANELALAVFAPDANASARWTNPSGWTRGIGPTGTWSQEAIWQTLAVASATSARATFSKSAAGFAGIIVFGAGQAAMGASPAPTNAPTNAPTAAPTSAPTAAPTASPTGAPVSSGVATYHGCELYAANDWFTTNLMTGGSSYVPNTIDPNSAHIINNIATNVGSINFAANVDPRAATVNVDTGSNTVANPQVQGLAYGFANDAYNDDPSPRTIPVTSGSFYQEGTYGCKQSGGDCHVNVLNTAKCVEYETYKSGTYGNGTSGSWNGSSYWAEGGGVVNLNHAYQVEPITVTAADIPMMGTTDWGEDLQYQNSACQPDCAIPHILGFFMPNAGQANGGYVTPAAAQQRACTSDCTYPLPEGARLRLKSSYACPTPGSYPQANLLCNQMKQYGIILSDFTGLTNGGGVRLGTSSDGANPWNSSDYDQFLGSVHIGDFDVMTLGTIH